VEQQRKRNIKFLIAVARQLQLDARAMSTKLYPDIFRFHIFIVRWLGCYFF